MRRLTPWLVSALLATGCNTCLDPASVPLVDDDRDAAPDVAAPDVADEDATRDMNRDFGTDSGRDVADDMPVGADSDTCIPEEPAQMCRRLGSRCGATTGTDRCTGEARTVQCGMCGANAVCNQNACECEAGYVADGPDCTRPPLVANVFFVDGVVTGVEENVSSPDYAVDKLVPFVSTRTTSPFIEGRLVDVVASGSGEFRLERSQAVETTWVEIYGVEFDNARVQRGEFTLTDASISVPLADSIDPSRAFAVVTTRGVGSDVDHAEEYMTRVSLTADAITVARSREGPHLTGHWWIVEASHEHFSSQHVTVSLSGNGLCAQADVDSVEPDRSFVVHSSDYAGPDEIAAAQTNCRLLDDTTVECCRLEPASMASSVTADVTVVSFASDTDSSVQRGVTPFAVSDTVHDITIDPPSERAIPWLGRIAPAAPSASEADQDVEDDEHGHVSGVLSPGGVLRLRRADDNAAAEVWWEVVDWPP